MNLGTDWLRFISPLPIRTVKEIIKGKEKPIKRKESAFTATKSNYL
jgi:hypothetical protein